MVRRLLVGSVLVALAVAPLGAELKVVSTMDVRKVEVSEEPNPFFAMMGSAVAAQMEQMNGIETTTIIGDGMVRTEFSRALPGLPGFTVTIMRADGTMIGLNASERTYYRARVPDVSELTAGGMKPSITVNRTGEFSTLLGRRVERVVLEMSMPLPVPPEAAAQLPPGFPSEVTMTVENWTADAYKAYGTLMIKANPTMAALGLSDVADVGFALRQIVRSPMLAGYEIENTVTSVAEEDLPDTLFDVPEGYKEVPPPPGVGR